MGRSGSAAGSRALLLGDEHASLALSVDLHTDGAVVSKAAVLEGVLVGEVVGLSAEEDAIAPDQEAVVLLDKLPSKLLRHVCWKENAREVHGKTKWAHGQLVSKLCWAPQKANSGP